MNLTNKLAFKIIQKNLGNNIDVNDNTKAIAKKTASDKTYPYLVYWLVLLGAAIVLGIVAWAVPFFLIY